jgi:hypothetical protein
MRCPTVYMDDYRPFHYEGIKYEDHVAHVRVLELPRNSERLDWNLGSFDVPSLVINYLQRVFTGGKPDTYICLGL